MGTTRNSRTSEALRPGWLQVDGRGPRRRLARAPETAALFNYFTPAGPRRGRWDRFFENEPLVVYARLAEVDVGVLEAFFLAALAPLRAQRNLATPEARAAARGVVDRLLALCQRVEGDASVLAALPAPPAPAVSPGLILAQAVAKVFQPRGLELLALRARIDERALPDAAVLDTTAAAVNSAEEKPPETGAAASAGATPSETNATPVAGATAVNTNANAAVDSAATANPAAANAAAPAPEDLTSRLVEATWAVHGALAQIVVAARDWFADAYATPRGLSPHFGLYLAFVQQFEASRGALNALPTRHLDYFYREVLRLAPAGPVPDTTWVAFTAAPGAWAELSTGTALLAGQDAAGKPIVYRTTSPVVVTPARVAQVATTWLAAPSLAASAGASIANTGAYVAPVANSLDGAGAKPLPPGDSWATFGEDQAALAPAARTMEDAAWGVALASPVLHLEEGARTITITVVYNDTPAPPTPAAAPPKDAALPNTPPADTPPAVPAPTKVPAGRWNADYSGAKSWVPVPATALAANLSFYRDAASGAITPQSLVFTLTLDPTSPACVNYALGAGYDPRVPVLRLRAANPLGAFDGAGSTVSAAFRRAAVKRIRIDVAAAGLSNLVLASPAGALAAAKPAAVFGIPPLVGGTLAVGKVEVFRKRLSALSLSLNWLGLPDADTYPAGLSDYYAGYAAALAPNPAPAGFFENAGYSVTPAARVPGGWKTLALQTPSPPLWPPDPTPPEALFGWDLAGGTALSSSPPPAPPPAPPTTGPLRAARTWIIDPAALAALTPDPGLTGPLVFGPTAGAGFLGLSLVAPAYAFGHALYPAAVAAIALQNAAALVASARPPSTELVPASAWTLLRVKVQPGRLARAASSIAKLFGKKRATTWTFDSRLFPKLADQKTFPAPVALALTAAGLQPPAALTALASLEGKTFQNLSGFEACIIEALGLDPANGGADAALDAVAGWLASLLYPAPPPAPVAAPAPMPRPPLTPTATDITLSYAASTSIELSGESGGTDPGGWDSVWQLAPLAVYPRGRDAAPLFPGAFAGGALHLGLADVSAPLRIAFLFQLEPAAAEPGAAGDPPAWSVLVGDEWRPLTDGVHDSTEGLLRSGIVRLDLPPEVDTAHTVMPAGLVWVRATTATPARRLRTVQILPNAVEAAWSPPDGATPAALAAHFAAPLTALAVTGLQAADARVAKVVQPLPSAGGAPPEDDTAFATRVSERLRHKGRACTPADHEHLLLQLAPGIFYARAVPPAGAADAGNVALVVLPVVRSAPEAVPPGFTPGDLLAFAEELAARAAASARIQVLNPSYRPVQVRAEITFTEDRSFTAQGERLTADVAAWVSPWIYAQTTVRDPVRRFHAAELAEFVRSLPYVVELGPCRVGWLGATDDDFSPAQDFAPTSPRELLIAASRHVFTPLSSA